MIGITKEGIIEGIKTKKKMLEDKAKEAEKKAKAKLDK